MFRVSTQIKHKDMNTYKRIKDLFAVKPEKGISLGDTPENLMKHSSYKRIKGRVRQVK